jgi:hypothetical protein
VGAVVVSPQFFCEGEGMEQRNEEMTVREASQRLGIRIASVYNALWDRLLEDRKDHHGAWLISTESVERYRLRRNIRHTATRIAMQRGAIEVTAVVPSEITGAKGGAV